MGPQPLSCFAFPCLNTVPGELTRCTTCQQLVCQVCRHPTKYFIMCRFCSPLPTGYEDIPRGACEPAPSTPSSSDAPSRHHTLPTGRISRGRGQLRYRYARKDDEENDDEENSEEAGIVGTRVAATPLQARDEEDEDDGVTPQLRAAAEAALARAIGLESVPGTSADC